MEEKRVFIASERATREDAVRTKWNLRLADSEQREMVLERDLKALSVTRDSESG